jgi:hypothetical protein
VFRSVVDDFRDVVVVELLVRKATASAASALALLKGVAYTAAAATTATPATAAPAAAGLWLGALEGAVAFHSAVEARVVATAAAASAAETTAAAAPATSTTTLVKSSCARTHRELLWKIRRQL